MLITAIILFAVAAIFGLVCLVPILQNKPTLKPAVFIHGALAAVGLVLLLIAVVNGTGPINSLLIFIAAAVGGFIMFALDIQKKSIPKILALGHPILAAVGLVLLLLFVFGS